MIQQQINQIARTVLEIDVVQRGVTIPRLFGLIREACGVSKDVEVEGEKDIYELVVHRMSFVAMQKAGMV